MKVNKTLATDDSGGVFIDEYDDQDATTTTGIEEQMNQTSQIEKSTPGDLIIDIKEESFPNYMKIKCDICGCETSTFDDLENHFHLNHSGSNPYVKCCGVKYALNKILSHIELHNESDRYQCKICLKVCRSEKALENHIYTHKKKSLTCKTCDLSFCSKKELKHHEMSHDANSFKCDICQKIYQSNESYTKHLKKHTNKDDPVQCPICKEWLKNRRRLTQHSYKHVQGEVHCKICNRICPTKKALEGHVRYWHRQEKNFKCSDCEKTFKLEDAYKEHVAIHTGAQLYNCPHCPKKNRSRSNMYVHIKRCHVDEWIKSKKAKSYEPNK